MSDHTRAFEQLFRENYSRLYAYAFSILQSEEDSRDATMRQIMTELGRWYNKTVVFEDADLMDMRLHFVAERSLSLPRVINRLSEIDGVRITLSADDITIQ